MQHYAHLIKVWAGTLPGWITGLGIFAVLAGLGWKALGQFGGAAVAAGAERDELPEQVPARATPTMKAGELTSER